MIISVSCTESIELSSRLKKRIVNKSDKTIVNEIQSEVGTITKYINSNDSVDLIINKKITTESFYFGLASPHTPKLNIYHDILYNLTDTTKVELLTSENSYNYDIYFDDLLKNMKLSKNDSVYVTCLSNGINESSDSNNPIIFTRLIISNKLLSITQKDYTMLEKFKEYYKK